MAQWKKRASKTVCMLLVFMMIGCAPTSRKVRPDLSLRSGTRKILLMPMDIELSTLTAGGLLKPHAEWTALAQKFVRKSLEDRFMDYHINLLRNAEALHARTDDTLTTLNTQLIKLHEVVGISILRHSYIKYLNLPSKQNKFDWSLGPRARVLKERFGTDYALFVYLRDSYASAGRVAFIAVAAVLGVGVSGGVQSGFASLVDLNDGRIVWFNRLVKNSGDLRTRAAAENSVIDLLSGFPLS